MHPLQGLLSILLHPVAGKKHHPQHKLPRLVALLGCLPGQRVRLCKVLGAAPSKEVQHAEIPFGLRIAVLDTLPEPLACLGIIFQHSQAFGVHHA